MLSITVDKKCIKFDKNEKKRKNIAAKTPGHQNHKTIFCVFCAFLRLFIPLKERQMVVDETFP